MKLNVAAEYVSLTDVFRGVLLFIAADMVLIALIVIFPQIVLYLPGL